MARESQDSLLSVSRWSYCIYMDLQSVGCRVMPRLGPGSLTPPTIDFQLPSKYTNLLTFQLSSYGFSLCVCVCVCVCVCARARVRCGRVSARAREYILFLNLKNLWNRKSFPFGPDISVATNRWEKIWGWRTAKVTSFWKTYPWPMGCMYYDQNELITTVFNENQQLLTFCQQYQFIFGNKKWVTPLHYLLFHYTIIHLPHYHFYIHTVYRLAAL